MRAITSNAFLVFLLIVFVLVDPILAKGGKNSKENKKKDKKSDEGNEKEEKNLDCWVQEKGERHWNYKICKKEDETVACVVAKGCPNGDEIRGCVTKGKMKDAKKKLEKKIGSKEVKENKKKPEIMCQMYKEIDGCTGECKTCDKWACNGGGKIGGGQNWMVMGLGGMVWLLWMIGHLGAMQGIGPI